MTRFLPISVVALVACSAAPVRPMPPPVVATPVETLPARPAVAPFEQPDLPQPVDLALAVTGTELRLHVLERHDTPVVELRWVLPGGRAHEQAGDRKSTRLNSSHITTRMPSSA